MIRITYIHGDGGCAVAGIFAYNDGGAHVFVRVFRGSSAGIHGLLRGLDVRGF